MTIQQLNSSNSYLVNGTIPSEDLSGPYVTYWIWARNSQGLVVNSPQYLVGMTPNYPVNATISIDVKPVAAQGKIMMPTLYVVNNSTGPIFGTISLVANGTVVSESRRGLRYRHLCNKPDLDSSNIIPKCNISLERKRRVLRNNN